MNDRLDYYKNELNRLKKEANKLEKLIRARGSSPTSDAILSSLYNDIIRVEKIIEKEKEKNNNLGTK